MKKSLKSEQEIVRRLVGALTLITWVEIQSNGKQVYPLGKGAVGQLLYDANGHVAAQLVRRRRKRFRSEDWKDASETESARAWKEYFGYFGTYSIDLRQRAVIHHVESGWFPNLLHSDQVRHFRFEGSKLILDANTKWGRVRIVWKRSTGRASKTAKNQEAYGGSVNGSALQKSAIRQLAVSMRRSKKAVRIDYCRCAVGGGSCCFGARLWSGHKNEFMSACTETLSP